MPSIAGNSLILDPVAYHKIEFYFRSVRLASRQFIAITLSHPAANLHSRVRKPTWSRVVVPIQMTGCCVKGGLQLVLLFANKLRLDRVWMSGVPRCSSVVDPLMQVVVFAGHISAVVCGVRPARLWSNWDVP